jgi:NADH-quinone oxidoreductase subunit J
MGVEPGFAFAFFALSLLAVAGAFWAAFANRMFHAVLSLLATLGAVAGLFFLLDAEFVATLQVLLYIGGVVVLIVFAVMLTPAREEDFGPPLVKWSPVAGIGVGLLTLFIISVFMRNPKKLEFRQASTIDYSTMWEELNKMLLDKYLVAFEVMSVVILVALVGSLYIARKKEK